MTEGDLLKLAEFDALAAGWGEDQRKFGIHQWAAFLRRFITEMEAAHHRQIIELLKMRTREIERRQKVTMALNDTRVKLGKLRLKQRRAAEVESADR